MSIYHIKSNGLVNLYILIYGHSSPPLPLVTWMLHFGEMLMTRLWLGSHFTLYRPKKAFLHLLSIYIWFKQTSPPTHHLLYFNRLSGTALVLKAYPNISRHPIICLSIPHLSCASSLPSRLRHCFQLIWQRCIYALASPYPSRQPFICLSITHLSCTSSLPSRSTSLLF